MLGTLRQTIRAADERVPVLQLRTLRQQRDDNLMLWAVNTGARLFSVFGGVALLLAIIGVYGVKSYVVSRRTREIGIRMALGATPSNVLWLVLREGLTLTLSGVGVGLLLAWGVARALERDAVRGQRTRPRRSSWSRRSSWPPQPWPPPTSPRCARHASCR